MTTSARVLIALALGGPLATAQAQHPAVGLGSPLAGLALPHKGKALHASSTDPTGGDGDFRSIAPGATITLLDYKGAGVVHRFWLTMLPRASVFSPSAADLVAAHRQTILRMYWDGEETPSVEVPLGDFFGVGFGEQQDYVSLPLSETSGGYNCYWPMPFHRAARWTATNLGGKLVALYWNVDFTGYDRLPKDVRHFHAQWRRENPTAADRDYTILDAHGAGHYVGAALFMQARQAAPIFGRLGFLEGDEAIALDGEATPSIRGTGTEDYFSSGFYFDKGLYSAPFHGVTIRDDVGGRVAAYRWHVEDAMPFRKSIHVSIEHGTGNQAEADYSSVAYFYQTEPHAPFPPLPADAALLLPSAPLPP